MYVFYIFLAVHGNLTVSLLSNQPTSQPWCSEVGESLMIHLHLVENINNYRTFLWDELPRGAKTENVSVTLKIQV